MPVRTVLKPFLYAEDHIRAEQLAVGDERDFPSDILPGLVAEGLVEAPAAAAPDHAEAAPAEPPAGTDAAPEPVSAPAKPTRKRA